MTQVATTSDGASETENDRVVYVVDDDQDFRTSLVTLLKSVDLLVEDFPTPAAFLSQFVPSRAGCILLDLRLPGMSGLELYEQLVRQDVLTPVIILTGHADVPTAVQALKGGVVEYLEKVTGAQALLDHVQLAMRNDAGRRRKLAAVRDTIAAYQQLTKRERQILALVASGQTSQEIADNLKALKRKTVEAHRARIMRKMNATNVADLVRKYLALRQAGAVDDVLPENDPPDADAADSTDGQSP